MLEIEIEKLPSFVIGKEKGKIEGREEGREEGIEIGIKQEREKIRHEILAIAKQLLNMNFLVDKIMEITGLSKSDIENLKKED